MEERGKREGREGGKQPKSSEFLNVLRRKANLPRFTMSTHCALRKMQSEKSMLSVSLYSICAVMRALA